VATSECRGAAPSSERTCIVTRAKALPEDMIRFVAGPGGAVVPDIRRKLPGRGVWVLGHAEVVAKAARGEAFSRGFKMKVTASLDLAQAIEMELKRDCLQALSLANKAGQVVAGFAKVERTIASGKICGFVHAADGSEDGARKIEQSVRRRFGNEQAKPTIDLFLSRELDLALGQTNVIHAALVEGAAGKGFLDRCRRLKLYRSVSPQGHGPFRAGEQKRDGTINSQRVLGPAKTEWAGTQDG
jgi:uncharacterized protein